MTGKRASYFREKKQKFFAGVASRIAKRARVESAEGVVDSTVCPFESSGGVVGSTVCPFESSGGVVGSTVCPFESSEGVVGSTVCPFESAGGVVGSTERGVRTTGGANRGKRGRKNENGGRRRERRRRVVVWSVFLTSAALAFGVADQGASQCFWRRWRDARRAASVRTFYAPTVVGSAPSTNVWTVPRTVAVARPVGPTWGPTAGTGAIDSTASCSSCSSFPSAPIASAPVCATWTPAPSETICASTETVASAAYPSQDVANFGGVENFGNVENVGNVASSVGTNGVCGNGCGDVCSTVATCADVGPTCDAPSTTCVEMECKEEEITTYETVWDAVTRYRDKTITRQVPETSIKREKVKVERPVWETVEKETTYDVTRYVPETSTQTRTRTTLRPVVQMRERKIVETVNQPVVETVMAQRSYVVNRPTTTYRTETRDYGGFETQITAVPGRERCCLRWRCGGDYWDPTTGRTKYRLPGLYWTPTQEPTEYRAQKVYRPNLVATQVPVTTYVPQTVVECVPTTRTTMRPVQVERTVNEPTTVYVRETQTELVPVTTYKPVKERVVKKTPTRVLRTQTTEEIRETPVTTYKTVTEIVREPYVERVARQVPKKTKVTRAVPVYKTVVPVSTRYLSETSATNATVERVGTVENVGTVERVGTVENVGTVERVGTVENAGTVETFQEERTDANVGKSGCCEPSGTGWDAADFAPSLTSRTTAAEKNGGENASGPNVPSAVPSVRRAARPIAVADPKTPPVVSPTPEERTAGERKGNVDDSTSFESFETTFEAAQTPDFAEFAEESKTSVSTSDATNDAASILPPPTVAPTRATSEERR